MGSGARKRKYRLHAGYYNSIRGLCLAGLSFRHREERSDAAVWIPKVTARPFANRVSDFKP